MPLVFSPLNEAVLDLPPRRLLPKHAFVMRQLGEPPAMDVAMADIVTATFKAQGIQTIDASDTTVAKDYLERILGLIRGTGFTVAIFSEQTRSSAMANIALELGFAAMCGKPLMIVKSKEAVAPSDLKRTDWTSYDEADPRPFRRDLRKALKEMATLHEYESALLNVALEAASPDCAVALERAIKGFLLSGDRSFISSAERLLEVLDRVDDGQTIGDLDRLRTETRTFIRQAAAALGPGRATPKKKGRAKPKAPAALEGDRA